MKFEPIINPIAFTIGPFSIYWYALMYLISLLQIIQLGCYRAKKPDSGWTTDEVKDMGFYLFIGAILGGRIGYTLFYNFDYFIHNPLYILGWNGKSIEWSGMSFHGGLLGVLLATLFIAKSRKKHFWQITDFIAPLIPIGLFFGRIGNFINGELWGKKTDQTWGIIFQHAPDSYLRHPSQLYEAALEGIVLFVVLWIFSQKKRPRCATSGLFLIGYGILRSAVEFFREPDAHIGYMMGDWLTRGMLLCIIMVIAGIGLTLYAYKVKKYETIS